MKIELRGLELFGHHGVCEEERERGQRFVYDVELEVGERGANDRIEDAVDYREVAAAVRRSPTRRFTLLEALATAIADALVERFPVERVKVRVRKPEVRPAGHRARVRGRHASSVRDACAYVGLGANLGDREATIRRAAELLGATRLSTIRETEPWGFADQPPFLNAVAELETDLPPRGAARPAARGRARARPHARGPALGAAHDRPRPAALRRARRSTSRA